MRDQKLIRGVIYDDLDEIKDRASDTAECMTLLSDVAKEYYEEHFTNSDIPTRDEFVTSVTLAGMLNPITGDENMIIPASLVDKRLYKDLKRIDIGDTLVTHFINETNKKHSDNETFYTEFGKKANRYAEFMEDKFDRFESLYHFRSKNNYPEFVKPQDFCTGEEECLLKHVDKQNENRGKYFLDGKEVSAEEMIEFMENEPQFADVVPFIKALNGKVSCF